MSECTEIKMGLNIQAPIALFLKKNENGIDSELQKSLQEIKKQFKGNPWLTLLDPPDTKSEKRLIEFAESRRCLLSALTSLKNPNSAKNIYLSLSHTTSHSVGLAVIDDQKQYRGVGVDIELKNREIKPEIKSKFTFKSEENLKLSALELWTIKEASFKANSEVNGESLFHYEVKEYDPHRFEGKTTKTESSAPSTAFKMYLHENLLITIALALNT